MNKYIVYWHRDDGVAFDKSFHNIDDAIRYQEELVFNYGYDAEVL